MNWKKILVVLMILFSIQTAQAETLTQTLDSAAGNNYVISENSNLANSAIKLLKGDTLTKNCAGGLVLTVTPNVDNYGKITINTDGSITVKPSSKNAITVVLNFGPTVHNYTNIEGTVTFADNKVLFNKGAKVSGIINLAALPGDRPFHYEITGGTGSLELGATSNIITSNKGAHLTGEVNNVGSLVFTGEGVASIKVDSSRTFHNVFLSEGIELTSAAEEYHFILEKVGNYHLNGMEIKNSKPNTTVYLINHNAIRFDAESGISCNGYTFDGEGTVTITKGNKITLS